MGGSYSFSKSDKTSVSRDHQNEGRGGRSLPAVPVSQNKLNTSESQPLTLKEEQIEKEAKPIEAFQLKTQAAPSPDGDTKPRQFTKFEPPVQNKTGLPDGLKAGVV